MKRRYPFWGVMIVLLSVCGCGATKGNIGTLATYKVPGEEAVWIRNGEPLLFEDVTWLPQDQIEIFLDSEVYLLGEYRGVQVFADKVDVRPYARLYTKFGQNKFRVFKKATDDKNKQTR